MRGRLQQTQQSSESDSENGGGDQVALLVTSDVI